MSDEKLPPEGFELGPGWRASGNCYIHDAKDKVIHHLAGEAVGAIVRKAEVPTPEERNVEALWQGARDAADFYGVSAAEQLSGNTGGLPAGCACDPSSWGDGPGPVDAICGSFGEMPYSHGEDCCLECGHGRACHRRAEAPATPVAGLPACEKWGDECASSSCLDRRAKAADAPAAPVAAPKTRVALDIGYTQDGGLVVVFELSDGRDITLVVPSEGGDLYWSHGNGVKQFGAGLVVGSGLREALWGLRECTSDDPRDARIAALEAELAEAKASRDDISEAYHRLVMDASQEGVRTAAAVQAERERNAIEALRPATCYRCNGEKLRPAGRNPNQKCGACNGEGVLPATPQQIAERIKNGDPAP